MLVFVQDAKLDPAMNAELRRLAFYGAGPKAAVADMSGEYHLAVFLNQALSSSLHNYSVFCNKREDTPKHGSHFYGNQKVQNSMVGAPKNETLYF